MRLFKKIPLGYWIILAAFILVSFLSIFRFFNIQELRSYDLRISLRPPLKVSEDIVIIEISDDTLQNLGRWPLPRDFHASLVSVLTQLEVKAIIFDILFSEPTLYDEAFAKSIKLAGNVYLPRVFYIPQSVRRSYYPESEIILGDIPDILADSCYAEGHINVFVDNDGKIRKVPLFIRHKDRMYPQIALKAACDSLGLNIDNTRFGPDKLIIDNRLILPIGFNAAFFINYPGKWSRTFQHFSYFEILKSYKDRMSGIKPKIDLDSLKGKICFIGLTATGTSDFRANPLESVYPMLGLQASLFNSIVNKEYIRDAGVLFNTLINLLILALSLIICLRLKPLRSFLVSISFGILYFLFSAGIFIRFGIWIDLFLPLFIIIFVYLGSTFYRFLDETRKNELIEKELDIARVIQKSFLPQDLNEVSSFEIASFMQPAKFVAGDLYDIIKINENKLGILIGDVSGKGVPAALIMAQTISLFRIFALQIGGCSQVLNRLNKELYGKFSGRFVTCLYMVIDIISGRVDVSSAGHAPLLFYSKAAQSVSEVELAIDVPLGIMEDTIYKDSGFTMEKGDKIAVFTDGVSEARDSNGREFGIDKVKAIMAGNNNLNAKQLEEKIKESLAQFSCHCPQHDDITIIMAGKV